MSQAALKTYGDLGRCIEEEEYYIPPKVDENAFGPFDAQSDPHGFERSRCIEAMKTREQRINKMEQDKSSLYGFILSKLSRESKDEMKRMPNYEIYSKGKDPLALWLSLKELHLTTTVSKDKSIVKAPAYEEYSTCRMNDFDVISAFKERFENKLEAYNAAMKPYDPNDPTPYEKESVSAMVFMRRLCPIRFKDFQAYKVNQINSDPTKAPKTINEMYQEARTHVVPVAKNNSTRGGSVL